MRSKVITLVVFVAAFCSAFGFGNARLGVRVIDSETGHPLSGLRVHGGFLNYSPRWGVAAKDNGDEKITDQEGFCRLSGNTERGESCCIVRSNEGFYDSGWYSFDYKERSLLKLGRWLPDDIVVTVRLDRVVNPIPLYVAKSKSLAIAKNDKQLNDEFSIAYDLLNNDWLSPLGKGEIGDVVFTCQKISLGEEPYRYPSGIHTNVFYRYDVRVRFPGVDNGVVECVRSEQTGLKMRVAPDVGYNAEYVSWAGRLSRTEYKKNFDKNRHFCFRIRTEHDKDGKIKSAYYGKIHGDFDLEVRDERVTDLSFLYYLNPTLNDHNLEWDRKHNLCSKPGDIGYPQP